MKKSIHEYLAESEAKDIERLSERFKDSPNPEPKHLNKEILRYDIIDGKAVPVFK